jgi:oligopeptidase B
LIDTKHPFFRSDIAREPPKPIRFRPRRPGFEYYVDHLDGLGFLVVNNDTANDGNLFQLSRLPTAPSDEGQWVPFVQLPPGYLLEDCDVFHKHVILYCRHEGLPAIFHLPISSKTAYETTDLLPIHLPHPVGSVTPGVNRFPDQSFVRFIWTSMGYMESVWHYDFNTKKSHCLRDLSIPSTVVWRPEDYRCHRIEIPILTPDVFYQLPANQIKRTEEFVPITLFYPKNGQLPFDPSSFLSPIHNTDTMPALGTIESNEPVPILLHSYGAYGVASEPILQPHHYFFLQKGFVVAFAHIRGGSELGRAHYENARNLHKWRTLRDLYTSIRFLRGDMTPEKIKRPKGFVYGTSVSAGGIAMGGACFAGLPGTPLSMHRILFGPHSTPPKASVAKISLAARWEETKNESILHGAVLHVPFLDPVSAMLDPDAPLTTLEYEEWGDVHDAKRGWEAVRALTAISPYNNIPQLHHHHHPSPVDVGRGEMKQNGLRLPWILMTAGGRDQRVPFWQPLKFVARCRRRMPEYYGHVDGDDEEPAVMPLVRSLEERASEKKGWWHRLRSKKQKLDDQTSEREKVPLLLLTREDGGHFNDTADGNVDDLALWIAFVLRAFEKQKTEYYYK